MVSRIILVRHGPSAHVHTAGAIDRTGMQAWREAYDSAGIQVVSQPTEALIQMAADAAHVVASDLPRAVASAASWTSASGGWLTPWIPAES